MSVGIYEAISTVNIRREPRIVETRRGKEVITNQVGQLTAGTQRTIFSVITNNAGETWGRVSEADGAGIAQWVCIRNLNREFLRKLEPDSSAPLEARVSALEAWARTQGFKE